MTALFSCPCFGRACMFVQFMADGAGEQQCSPDHRPVRQSRSVRHLRAVGGGPLERGEGYEEFQINRRRTFPEARAASDSAATERNVPLRC
jgi:hypothetical protein